MARPSTVPASVVRTMLRFWNRSIGISGLVARSSTNTNATAATRAISEVVMMVGELHSYWVPPHVVVRISEVVATTISVVPR